MQVKLGVSNRHVHLNQEDYDILFKDTKMEVVKNLNQPTQFASNLFVTIKTPKSSIENVRVLGPIRKYTQVEVSKTDSYKLGINPPVRDSGDVLNSELLTNKIICELLEYREDNKEKSNPENDKKYEISKI